MSVIVERDLLELNNPSHQAYNSNIKSVTAVHQTVLQKYLSILYELDSLTYMSFLSNCSYGVIATESSSSKGPLPANRANKFISSFLLGKSKLKYEPKVCFETGTPLASMNR